MDGFVARQNIDRFVGLLDIEVDDGKRATLRGLLIEQEDRFGRRQERLQHTLLTICSIEARVERQRAIVKSAADAPAQLSLAEQRLSNMLDTLSLLRAYRQHLAEASYRDGP
jgi:hypothetical protein